MSRLSRIATPLFCLALLLAACSSRPGASAALGNTPAATPLATDDCPDSTAAVEICAPGYLRPPTNTPLPQAGPALQETQAQYTPTIEAPTATPPAPTSTACPNSTWAGPLELCLVAAQYFLQRPIQPPGNDEWDLSYRFGSTQSGLRDPHHGVEFLNPYGTPVVAAADGVVVVAGQDLQPVSPQGAWPILFYGPYSNFYGNLVVIEHRLPASLVAAFPQMPQPIYTLYGHLSEISVQVSETVKAGQVIGQVGQAGIATGPHLHFEVRLGENTYASAHNPELWLLPGTDENGQPFGGIAGAFIDPFGNQAQLEDIVIQHLPGGPGQPPGRQVALRTYEEKALVGLPPWGESFGVGDLPAGWYRITYPNYGLKEHLVQVLPGQLTILKIPLN